MKSRFEKQARIELGQAVDFSGRRFGLSREFTQAVQRSIQQICDDPMRFRRVGKNLHLFRMDRFPYNLIYRFDPEFPEVVIVVVAHQRREPGYWLPRIPD